MLVCPFSDYEGIVLVFVAAARIASEASGAAALAPVADAVPGSALSEMMAFAGGILVALTTHYPRSAGFVSPSVVVAFAGPVPSYRMALVAHLCCRQSSNKSLHVSEGRAGPGVSRSMYCRRNTDPLHANAGHRDSSVPDRRQLAPHKNHNIQQTLRRNNANNMVYRLSLYTCIQHKGGGEKRILAIRKFILNGRNINRIRNCFS